MTTDIVHVPGNHSGLPQEFKGLSKKQMNFAIHYVDTGGRNATESCRIAGYANTSCAYMGCHLLKHDKVLAYVKHLVEGRMTAGVAAAWDTLFECMSKAPWPQRRAAASEILDRGGLMMTKLEEKNININVNTPGKRSPAELRAELAQLMKEDPALAKLVNQSIDAEMIDVTPEPEAEPVEEEVDWSLDI